MKTYFKNNAMMLFAVVALCVGVYSGTIEADTLAAAPVLFAGTSTITSAFVQQWDDSIRHQSQQTESRLMRAVTDRGDITGASFTVNNLASIELDENTVRHGDTEWAEITHGSRLAVMKDFYKALPLDRNDIPKMIVNPVTGGDYMKALMNAKNRKIDAIIYSALLGTITSVDGTSSFVLPAGQKIAGGGTGFTKSKIIQARAIFRANECDDETGEELFILYNDVMLQQLLADTTLTSADFMAVQMLQAGKVADSWMGFSWIPYQGLNKAGSVYSAVAWAKSGIHFGKGYEEGNVGRRGDKKDLWQVSMGASYGAGRQDEAKVVQVDFQ